MPRPGGSPVTGQAVGHGPARAIRVTFYLTEHDGIARRSFPITGGIPLARGVVKEADALGLLDDRGEPVDLQARVTSRWPDCSARWLLLDFQTDVGALRTVSYTLTGAEVGAAPEVAAPGVVDGEPIPRCAAGPTALNSHLRVVDAEGHRWTDMEPGPTAVVCRGPLRSTVLTTGAVYGPHRRRRLRWEARTSFYRETPWTRTQLTYVADAGPGELRLHELAVVVQVGGSGPRRYCFAPANAPWAGDMTPLVSDGPGMIYQADANDSRVTAADGTVLHRQTLKNRGYVGVAGESGGLALALADFWQGFPKGMRATETSLEAQLWPAQAAEPFALPAGAARTHTLILMPYDSAEELDSVLIGLTTPMLPRRSVKDLNASGVMPALPERGKTRVPFLEALTEMMFTGWSTFTTQANSGVWGFGELHFGDFRAESYADRQVADLYGRGVIWGNQEAQVPFGMLVQYLRTGSVGYLLQGLACARHQADVDTIHDDTDPGRVGAQHVHGANHAAGPLTPSHMWTSGIALAFLLTGDDRLKTVLASTGEYLLRASEARDLDHIENRDGGWHLIALCACHEALGDPRYIEQGRHLLEGLRRWIDRGARCLLPPAMTVFAPVHLFIALTGVRDYWRLTGDPLARETLLRGGRMAVENGFSDLGFFTMEDGQSYRMPSRWQLCHCLPIMEVLYEITGEMRWIEIGMRQARLMLTLLENETRWGLESNWAQGGIYFSYAFSFFETAGRLGLLTDIRQGG